MELEATELLRLQASAALVVPVELHLSSPRPQQLQVDSAVTVAMQQLRELVEWVVLAAMHSRMATTKVPLAELVETVATPQPELLVPAVQEA